MPSSSSGRYARPPAQFPNSQLFGSLTRHIPVSRHRPQFTDLSGAAVQRGDLKNTVLHSVTSKAIKSTFPLSVRFHVTETKLCFPLLSLAFPYFSLSLSRFAQLGVDITGVDAQTYSHTGQSYSQIVLPRVDTTAERTLQEDDPQVAYGTLIHLNCDKMCVFLTWHMCVYVCVLTDFMARRDSATISLANPHNPHTILPSPAACCLLPTGTPAT